VVGPVRRLDVNSPVARAPSGLAGQESKRFRLLISYTMSV